MWDSPDLASLRNRLICVEGQEITVKFTPRKEAMKLKQNTALIILMIVIAAMTRLIPHYPNFTAVGAIALFGGAYLGRRWAFVVPLLALFISDLVLNNLIYAKQFPEIYEGFTLFYAGSWPVYLAFIAVILLGAKMLKKVSISTVLGTSVVAAVVFFLITNFAVWAGVSAYPKTLTGLTACYTAAIPFFWNTVMGNVFFGSILFGGYEWIRSRQMIAEQA